MTTPIIGLFVLLVIALIGWAIAETKNKVIKFEHSKAEEEDMKKCKKLLNTMVEKSFFKRFVEKKLYKRLPIYIIRPPFLSILYCSISK